MARLEWAHVDRVAAAVFASYAQKNKSQGIGHLTLSCARIAISCQAKPRGIEISVQSHAKQTKICNNCQNKIQTISA